MYLWGHGCLRRQTTMNMGSNIQWTGVVDWIRRRKQAGHCRSSLSPDHGSKVLRCLLLLTPWLLAMIDWTLPNCEAKFISASWNCFWQLRCHINEKITTTAVEARRQLYTAVNNWRSYIAKGLSPQYEMLGWIWLEGYRPWVPFLVCRLNAAPCTQKLPNK